MARPAAEWIGKTKGMLTVLDRVGSRGTSPLYRVRCECGTVTEMTSSALNGATISCGCYKRSGNAKRRHGMSPKNTPRPRIYRTWLSMRHRCSNPSSASYERYGGAGIKVCERWDTSFDNFLADMGQPPTERHTIDRIDPTKGYEPGNCRWATYEEQARRQTRTRLDEAKVKLIRESSLPHAHLAQILGVTTSCVFAVRTGKTWKGVGE